MTEQRDNNSFSKFTFEKRDDLSDGQRVGDEVLPEILSKVGAEVGQGECEERRGEEGCVHTGQHKHQPYQLGQSSLTDFYCIYKSIFSCESRSRNSRPWSYKSQSFKHFIMSY